MILGPEVGQRAFLRFGALLCIMAAAIARPAVAATPPQRAALPLDIGGARALVLYFIASDCPISNRTLPEMLRVEHEFAARGVRFFFVYPNTTETPATIRDHRAAYSIGPNVLTDPDQRLARLTGANTTPEAAVLIPQDSTLKPVYVGRIDDRYLSIGTERPAPTPPAHPAPHAAQRAAHPLAPPGGPPVGCAFMNLPMK
jgi:hypothetical protein